MNDHIIEFCPQTQEALLGRVVVNFFKLSQVIFLCLLFLGVVMYASEVETKEK